ncbi:MAG: NAD(+) synthase [Christensenellaceae bacterium]|jgi:NAD+ synthase (glutamine-hydrolysing)|nr:NAD(+) synthase [Christensenellaceae bacterium]
MKDGFLKLCCATPEVSVANPQKNAAEIIRLAKEAAADGAALAVFPELCITGYTCGDLFLSGTLLRGAEEALALVAKECAELPMLLVAGLPVAFEGKLYNCAALVYQGRVLGLVPKQNIPNYTEFYEARHFSPGPSWPFRKMIPFLGGDVFFGPKLLFECEDFPEFTIGIELCEDLWVVNPPSNALALGGAMVLINPSASNEVVGKAAFRRNLVAMQSAKTISAYLYASAGFGESSQDLVFAGHNLLCENGSVLSESKRFSGGLSFADADLYRLKHERARTSTFVPAQDDFLRIPFRMERRETALSRAFPRLPFVPDEPSERRARCEEILDMQAAGLATRLHAIGMRDVTLGLSGGLDSTLALIVAVRAFDRLSLPRKGIHALTMPCFGTTARTRSNAELLALAYGADFREINISKSVLAHFDDIGQSPDLHDLTYENAQARERTQVLMDMANKLNALVVGTGDLSELALGWATYNGDHMAMYGVNASIPKTLVRHLVAFEAEGSQGPLAACLLDILATPVSPELLPPKDGLIAQKTEDIVGPYELHDFFLYYFARFGMEPQKILRLAKLAFEGAYEEETIKKWLKTFLRRFFSQQFKRSCLPDGPKVGTVTLSPRGDWRMPSDASSALWLQGLE